MPFKSEKQRKWMWKNAPEMADKWAREEKYKRRKQSKNKTEYRKPRGRKN